MSFGRPCPVSDLFGVKGRELLAKLEVPEPWAGNVLASVELIDSLVEGEVDLAHRGGSRVLVLVRHRALLALGPRCRAG